MDRHLGTFVLLNERASLAACCWRNDMHVVATTNQTGSQALSELCGTVDIGAERVTTDENGQFAVRGAVAGRTRS
jgi:hypothetical protein